MSVAYTQRHYNDVVALLTEQRAPLATIEAFAALFKADNDRFNEARFMAAIGQSHQGDCQGCLKRHGTIEACMIGVLAGVVRDRLEGQFTDEQLDKATAEAIEDYDTEHGPSVDQLWDAIGPIVDRFEQEVRAFLPDAGTREEGGRL